MAADMRLVAVSEYFQSPYGGVSLSKKDQVCITASLIYSLKQTVAFTVLLLY